MRAFFAAAVAAPLLFAACGESGERDTSSSSGTTPTKSAADQVVMELVAFAPENLEVSAGTAVTWQQKDPGAHTVTSGTVEQGGAGVTQQPDGKFDSGEIATGDSFEFTFAEPGTYPYFCSLHPATMRGEIRVV